MVTFIELCKQGKAEPCDIDEYIEAWHNLSDKDPLYKSPLHTFLGMTWEQYSIWLIKPSYLEKIVLEN